MDRANCPTCGEEHDLSDFEPTYRRPDAFLAVPTKERYYRTVAGSDDCRVRDEDESNERFFLRVLLPIPVRGTAETCRWGVWVEVDPESFARTRELWDASEAEQLGEPRFPARLNNELKGYVGTLGLRGLVQLTGPNTAPRFTLDSSLDHPLAAEQRHGVYPERVVEWLAAHIH
jgi:hypothetical protein